MQYHDVELDYLNKRNESDYGFKVVRTYQFKPGAYRKNALYCKVWFPDWPEDLNRNPAVSIQLELVEAPHVDVLKNRVHVWAHWSVPTHFVCSELFRFLSTVKQMYEL